jgi:ribulose-phosphate 3-epimerase
MPLRGAPAGWRLDTAWAAWGIAGAALGNLLVWGLLHGLNDQLWPWTRQTVSLRLSLNPGSGWFVNLWGVALALEAICGLLLTASLGLLVYGSDRARKAGLRVPGGRWAWLWVASAAAATALVLLGGQRNWRGDHLSFIGLLDWFALCLALIGAMLLLNGPLRWGRLAVGQQLGRLSRWVLIAAMVPATAPLLLMLASFTAEALSWWALVQRLDDYHVLAQGIDTGTTFAGWFLYATTALPSMLWSLGLLLVAILAHQARRELMECSDRSVPLRQLLGGLLSPAKPKPRSAPALPGPEPLPMPSQAQNPLPTQPSRPTFSLDMTPPENAARLRPPDPATALAQIDRRAAHRHDHRMIHQPPKQPLVCVSILSADFGIMARECQDVLSRGADMLHVDVMDGHFAPNLTMGPDMVRALRQHFPEVFLDVHLMVERPEMFIEPFAKAGASLCSFHAELCKPHKPDGLDAAELIRRIRGLGMSAGMVVNPPTAAEALEPWLDQIDLALVMSVHPGYSGQTFMPEALPKLRWLAQRVGPGTRLEVDGGVKPENVDQIVQAGADVLVTASALFGAQDRSAVIRRFHEAPMPT